MSISKMSGLQLLQSMIADELPHPAMADTIPMKGVSVKKGNVIFEVKADHRHLNPMGGVHGGFMATVIDTVTGCAVHTMLEAGVNYSTIELNVKMLKAIPVDIALIAEGNIINCTRRLAVSEGVIKDADGKIYAYGSATCMIL